MNYYDIPRISNSGLSCIDPQTGGNPEKYKDFIDGKLHKKSLSMSLGDIIHRYLLQNEQFAVIDKKPGDVLTKILDEYHSALTTIAELTHQSFSIESDPELLLKTIRSNGYYNNRKDDTVLDLVTKDGADYFSFLVRNNGKAVIPKEWQDILERLSLSVLRGQIQEIIEPLHHELLTEFEILFDLKAKSYLNSFEKFECKAKIDRLVIDHESKTYRIVDVKSTSQLLEDFSESIKKYKYHRQMAFYSEAVRHFLPKGYRLTGIYILALETMPYYRARLYLLDNNLLRAGRRNFLSLLKRISYHTSTLNWIYPLEEEVNQGVYLINSLG